MIASTATFILLLVGDGYEINLGIYYINLMVTPKQVIEAPTLDQPVPNGEYHRRASDAVTLTGDHQTHD